MSDMASLKQFTTDPEFGKDAGLLHQYAVHCRTVPGAKQCLERLVADKPFLKRMIEAAMNADPSVFHSQVSSLQLAPLQAMLSMRLGRLVEVASMPESFTDENLARWASFNFRPVFLPELTLTRDLELPNWTKPGDWLYDQISQDKVEEEGLWLRGGWRLVDFTVGVDYTDGAQVYQDDPLAPIIAQLREQDKVGGYDNTPAGSRFAITWDEWQEQVLPAIATELGLNREQVRLERVCEFNAIGNIYDGDRGRFNSWEWFQDEFGTDGRLLGGCRGVGGLADVNYGWQSDRSGSIAGRPLVSFCPPQAD